MPRKAAAYARAAQGVVVGLFGILVLLLGEIDLSVGASDLPAPPEALQTLQAAIQDPSTHSCECQPTGW